MRRLGGPYLRLSPYQRPCRHADDARMAFGLAEFVGCPLLPDVPRDAVSRTIAKMTKQVSGASAERVRPSS